LPLFSVVNVADSLSGIEATDCAFVKNFFALLCKTTSRTRH